MGPPSRVSSRRCLAPSAGCGKTLEQLQDLSTGSFAVIPWESVRISGLCWGGRPPTASNVPARWRSVDPRIGTTRGIRWCLDITIMFGTRSAYPIWASGQPTAPQRPALAKAGGRTHDRNRPDRFELQRPCETGAVHRWIPALHFVAAGMTSSEATATFQQPVRSHAWGVDSAGNYPYLRLRRARRRTHARH